MNYLKTGIDMRAIKIMSVICLFIWICSCESSVETKYIIENDTKYEINIELYSRYFDRETSTRISIPKKTGNINLNQDGGYWQKTYSEDMATNSSIGYVLNADSVIITFDNVKRSFFTISDTTNSNRNILFDYSYEILSKSVRRRVYKSTRKFLFTNEDYNNAEEIDGG